MKGRVGVNRGGGGGGGGGGVPADLMVCFPSRARLKFMPKPICSPSRPAETACKRPVSRPAAGGRSQASPLFKTETKHLNSEIGHDDEPTSPKVTCAGQIKVSRPKCRSRATIGAAAAAASGGGGRSSTRNWVTVVEEIERLHTRKKKPHWLDAVGLKRDVMQFLGAGFRGLRFPTGSCFGSLPGPVGCTSDDEDVEDEEEEEAEERVDEQQDREMERNDSKTIFSKWFMVLEENQGLEFKNNKEDEEERTREEEEGGGGGGENDEDEKRIECFHESADPASLPGPPANALLLMRCRSAPAKGWLKRREVEEEEEEEEELKPKWSEKEEKNAKLLIDDEELRENERRLVLMNYASDYLKISTDIAKETWIVGCVDPMARSRSWKR